MPTRMLRDWTDSQKFDNITAESERLFGRLVMKADDFGRFHGDAGIINKLGYPQHHHLRTNDIERWLEDLSNRKLIFRYELRGRKYLAIVNSRQRLRIKHAKFPPPEGHDGDWLPNDGDLLTNDSDLSAEEKRREEKKKRTEEEESRAARFEVFWEAYPKKVGKRAALTKWMQLNPDLNQCLEAIEHQRKQEQWRKDGGQYIPHPDTWLHQGRWDDVAKVEVGRRTQAKEKPDPRGWAEWRDTNYPDADKISYWAAPEDIQKEFYESIQQAA